MKMNGFSSFIAGGKPLHRLFAVFLLVAFALASFPVESAFAAPPDPVDQEEWNQKVDNLQAEIAILNNMVTQPGKFGNSEEQAKYRDKYIAAMRAAQSLLVGGGAVIPVTGNAGDENASVGSGMGSYYQKHPEKLLALYLHQMRKLREKMEVSNRNNTSNGGSGGSGTGTP